MKIKVWVACSGGADSVFLLRILHTQGIKVGVLHCNFQLRDEESDEDERFVRELCNSLQIKYLIKHFDVKLFCTQKKISIQEAARKLRYSWFEEIYNEYQIPIALAHHQNDQQETFLLQLQRGGGIKGLAAMPQSRFHIIRPLLHIYKKEILATCKAQNWQFRTDSSNLSKKYKRNALRIEFMEVLEQNHFDFDLINQLVSDYQKLLSYLPEIIKCYSKHAKRNEININKWTNTPIIIQKYILDEIGLGQNNLDAVNQLVTSQKGAYLQRKNLKLIRDRNTLFVKNISVRSDDKLPDIQKEILANREGIIYEEGSIYLDFDNVVGDILYRFWKARDRFSPLGLNGTKLVSKFLKDRKVSVQNKSKIVVAIDAKGIIAVLDYTVDNRVKITTKTKQILRIFVK